MAHKQQKIINKATSVQKNKVYLHVMLIFVTTYKDFYSSKLLLHILLMLSPIKHICDY